MTQHDPRCVACLEPSPVWKLCDACYKFVKRHEGSSNGKQPVS